MLGPIVNPLIPERQMLGVYDLKMARLYHYIYQHTSCDFSIVHSLGGYDEISLTGPFKVINRQGENIYTPEELGFKTCRECDLDGGNTVQDAANIFDDVLNNTATDAQKNCVIANAAFAMQTVDSTISIAAGIDRAKESIESGKAKRVFREFVKLMEN